MEKTQLKFKTFKNNGKYVLAEDYTYSINGYCITVPKGFLTDLASVPLPFRIFFPKDGEYTPAVVVHDWLYSKDCKLNITREEADKIFLEIMEEWEVAKWKRQLMYRMVRMFGARHFRKG